MAINLLPKLFGSGLQVDSGTSSNTRNVYVPPTQGEGYPNFPSPFFGNWENPIGMGVKKKKSKGKGLILGKRAHSTQFPFWAPFFD